MTGLTCMLLLVYSRACGNIKEVRFVGLDHACLDHFLKVHSRT